MSKGATYHDAGVNIDEGNAFVQAIKPLIQKTKRPEVLSSLGGFASLFSINQLKYESPVLVSSTDGVGTKLKIAGKVGLFKGLGQDLVAMCVNDLVCTGAEPLFFLDYFACGHLDTQKAIAVIEGITDSLAAIQCALVGGETAEMPGVYDADAFDLAGFAVGVVNRPDIIDGSGISIGNRVVGLGSSGLHSNGFSLVRKIIEDQNLDLMHTYPGFSSPLGETLLEPTQIYVNPILKFRRQFPLLGIAHITGGGLLENLPRILPQSAMAKIQTGSWPRQIIFEFLQKQGGVEASEMYRVFNCGIGMALVVEENFAEEVCDRFTGAGFPAWIIGEIIPREEPEGPQIILE